MKFDFSRILWGSGFVLVGSLMLLDRLGMINFDFIEFFNRWWPLVLVFIGVNIILNRNPKSGKRARAGEG